MTANLPPASLACALELVGAVRDRDPAQVAHVLRNAAADDGLEALAVSLASMVDDERTLGDLLAWRSPDHADVEKWRRALTDEQCRVFRNAWQRGCREPETVDGWREFEKRRVRKSRNSTVRRLGSVA